MPFTPGETVGPYRVVEQLGQGGMATVFKAYHPALDRDVAIKVLHAAFKSDPQFFARFKREAQIVARLEHPNIIPIYDFNEHEGEPYLVMRYVSGQTLKARMQTGQLAVDDVLRLMRPICDSLAYAHDQGILHRDIKPSNIMLAEDGRPFLTDFGLARMVQMGESTLSQDMMLGTPQYVSPEQAQGEKDLDAQTDIYSLGIVLFEMLTGSVPFSGDTPFAVIHDHIYKPLPLPRTLNPNIDPAAEKVILKALAKGPDDRFKTVREFWAAMEAALGAAISTTAVEAPAKKNRLIPFVAWPVIVLVLLLVGLFLLQGHRQQRSAPQAATQAQAAQVAAAIAGQQDTAPPLSDVSDDKAQANQPDADSARAKAEHALTAGQNLARKGQYPAALEQFEQAIEADPTYLSPYYAAAELTYAQHPEQAVAYLEQAIAASGETPDMLLRLGYAQLHAKDPARAKESFQAVLTQNEDSALAYAGLARVEIANDSFEQASAYWSKAQALDGDAPEVMVVQGYLLWKQGKLLKARRLYQSLAERSDLSPGVRLELERVRQLLQEASPRNRGGQ